MSGPWSGRLGLAALAARRGLRPAFVALVLVLLVLALRHDWGFAASVVAGEGTAALARGHARQGVWAVALLCFTPLLVHRASRAAADWRARDADWIAPLPLGRSAWIAAQALGLLGGAALVFAAAALAAELPLERAGGAWRWVRTLEHPAFALVEGDAGQSWVQSGLAARPPGARLWCHPTVAPGSGPAASVRLSAATEGGGAAEVLARLSGRAHVSLELPLGDGPVHLAVERVGPGAVVVLPPGALELVVPARAEGLASLELLARALLAGAVGIALGLGLGAWMRPALATGTLAALSLLPALFPAAARFLPAGDLPAAWRLVGEGFVPPPLAAPALAAGLGLLVLGAALAALGQRRGRSVA